MPQDEIEDPFATDLPPHPGEGSVSLAVKEKYTTHDPVLAKQAESAVDEYDDRADPFSDNYDSAYEDAVKKKQSERGEYPIGHRERPAVVAGPSCWVPTPEPASTFADIPGLKPASAYVTTVSTADTARNGHSKVTTTVHTEEAKPSTDPTKQPRKLSDMFVVSRLNVKVSVTRSPLAYNKIEASADVELSVIDNDVPMTSVPRAVTWLLTECNKQVDAATGQMIDLARRREGKP